MYYTLSSLKTHRFGTSKWIMERRLDPLTEYNCFVIGRYSLADDDGTDLTGNWISNV